MEIGGFSIGGAFITFSPLIFLGFFVVAETILLASFKRASILKSFSVAFLTGISTGIYFVFLLLMFGFSVAVFLGESDSAKRSNFFTFFVIAFLVSPIWFFLTSFLLAWLLKIFTAGKSALYATVLTILRFLVLGIFGLIIYLI